VGASVEGSPDAPKLLVGTGAETVHLLVVITAERGLCGPFNTNVGRFARNRIRALEAEGRTVKILAVGRKGAAYLKREFASRFVGEISFAGQKRIGFDEAARITGEVTALFEQGGFDICSLVYNRFRNVISQTPVEQRLIPAPLPEVAPAEGPSQEYEYEPDEAEILARILPQNLAIQVYRSLLDNSAGEQGSRMTAMDNATRNAGDMINKLTLNYNRTRQANITKELIEIISGAEAV
jgi:F-type H+-transporting ATPase subunit gamma